MSSMPETRTSGDNYIAYLVMGGGPFDLVYVPGFVASCCGSFYGGAQFPPRRLADDEHDSHNRNRAPMSC
jgi:hypothetical protein